MSNAPSLPRPAVLHVAMNPITGPWSVMRELAKAQAASGLFPAVGVGVIADRSWPDDCRREFEAIGLPRYETGTAKLFGTAAFLLQRLVRPPIGDWAQALAADSQATSIVVHFHNAWLSGVFLPLIGRRAVPVRVVATFHGVNADFIGQPIRRRLHRWMAARLLKHGAILTSVDRMNTRRAETILGIGASHFTIVPNGVPDAPNLRAAPWTGGGEMIVGHVGSITPSKGWHLTAEAVLLLRSEGLPIRLVIAGTGPEAEAAQEMARGNPDAIQYAGHITDPRRNLLPTLHVLAVMSAHEGLPMTIIEAMSVGLPVVSTSVGGIPEAVMHDETGIIVPRDAGSLAQALRELYQSSTKWHALSRAARQSFDQRFEINRIVEAYQGVYQGASERAARVPAQPQIA